MELRTITVTLLVPADETGQALEDWFKAQPELLVGTREACSKHGSAVMILRNTRERTVNAEETDCVRTMLMDLLLYTLGRKPANDASQH